MNSKSTSRLFFIVCLIVGLVFGNSFAAGNLTVDKAGQIGQPTGKIAFIRDGNIWTIDASGSNLMKISETTNAYGRLSWSPDGKEILFTRSGKLDLKGPDLLGGIHKVYDLFKAYPDSAINNNTMHWLRITNDLGSRDPDWAPNGDIIFWKDLNANVANAVLPNYQACTMDSNGDNVKVLRKDWQFMEDAYMIAPSLSSTGYMACVMFFDMKPQGLVTFPIDEIMTSVDTLKVRALKQRKRVAPAWSPDGKWLAYVSSDMNKSGLYIATPDLKEHFLTFTPPVSTYVSSISPSFSGDSKWLTFATTDGSVWIVDITGNGARRLTPPGLDKSPAWTK